MKFARSLAVALALAAFAPPVHAAQTESTPPCQYAPSAVQGGGPPSCGMVMGFIGSDGLFHQVTSSDGLPTTGGGGGGGGAVTVANGADVVEGTKNDTHTAGTVVGFLKDMYTALTTGPVPVSASALPLPTGASTATNQTNVQSAPGTPQTVALTIQGNSSGVAVPVSAAALPLPTGAATSALQTTGNTSLATIATNTAAATPAGTNLIGKVGIDQTTPGTTNGVQVNAALPAGTNLMGKVGIDQTTPGTTNGVSVTNNINTSATGYSANVTNAATAASGSAGNVKWMWVGNNNSNACYLQIFDLATGSVTLGTTAPKYSFYLPALGGGNINLGGGITFATAITVAITTTRSGSTACTSGADVNLGF